MSEAGRQKRSEVKARRRSAAARDAARLGRVEARAVQTPLHGGDAFDAVVVVAALGRAELAVGLRTELSLKEAVIVLHRTLVGVPVERALPLHCAHRLHVVLGREAAVVLGRAAAVVMFGLAAAAVVLGLATAIVVLGLATATVVLGLAAAAVVLRLGGLAAAAVVLRLGVGVAGVGVTRRGGGVRLGRLRRRLLGGLGRRLGGGFRRGLGGGLRRRLGGGFSRRLGRRLGGGLRRRLGRGLGGGFRLGRGVVAARHVLRIVARLQLGVEEEAGRTGGRVGLAVLALVVLGAVGRVRNPCYRSQIASQVLSERFAGRER